MMPDLTHGLVGPDEQFGVNHPDGMIEIEMYFALPVLACCRALCPPPCGPVALPGLPLSARDVQIRFAFAFHFAERPSCQLSPSSLEIGLITG